MTMTMSDEERRRRLRKVYALLTRLADESAAPVSETLPGDGAGVAEDADKRQSHTILPSLARTGEQGGRNG